MPLYNARIDFSADAKKVEQAIDRIEQRLNRLRDKAAKISLGDVGGGAIDQQKLLPPASKLTKFEQTTKAIADSAKRASTALKGLAVAGGALAGADAINALGKSLEKASVSIDRFGLSVNTPIPALNQLGANLREATAGIEPFVQALQNAGAGGLTTAAGIATATTAFVAFEPAITAALDKLKVSEKLFRLLSPAIKDTEVNFDGYIKKIRRATDVVSNLRESQRIIRRELDNVNSSTEEAADTAGAYVRVTERLNDQLREQANLLRQVRGFTVENVATGEVRTLTELEATKGRQSIATRQKAAEFIGEQYNRAVEVANSWKEFFKEADEIATSLKEEAKKTKGEQYNRAVEIRKSWNEFFKEADDTALKLKSKTIERGQTVRNSWNEFFVEATNLAEELRQQTARVSLREQERKIKVQETISRGRSVRIARERSEFLTGTSGNKPLGPLLGPGGAGFPVALPRTAAEEAVLQQKRRAAELSGLQKNLAKLAVAEAEARLDSARAAAQQKGEEKALLRINDEQLRISKEATLLKDKQLRISKEATLLKGDAAFSPIKGRKDIEGSPEFLKARAGRRKEALSNAIIGGAFPLLFGQGLGAAVGGGAGGALGGLAGGQFGFGLSLVGTALGTVFDGLVDGAKRLGKALNPLTADVNAIVEATGQTDTVLGKLLVAYGDQDRAVELLSATIGKKSVTDLRRFGENVTKLTQEFSKSVTQLQVALLPLLNKVTKFLASQARNTRLDQAVFRGTFTGVELNTAFQNDPELIKAVEKFNKGLISEKELVFLGRRIALQRELGKELQLELQLRTKAVNETARSVQIERGRLALQAIGDNPFSQAKFELQEQVALQEKLIRDQQLLSEAKKDPLKAAQLQNNLALSQIKYESELAVIAKNKTAAEIKGINERYRLTKQLFSLEGKAVNANLQRLNDYANVLTRLNSALTSKISAAELLDEAILETSLVGGLEIDKITTQESGVIDALKRKIGDGTNLGSLDVQRFAELQSGVRSEEEIRAIDERFDTLKNVAKFEAKARTSILTIRKEELIAQERLEQSQRRAAFATEKSTLEARIKSPFGGDKFEQDLLGIEQLNRRTKELGELQADIDTKERAANKLRALGYLDTADRVDVEAKALRSRLTLREQEIAQIEELELAQLKLAQTVENVYGFVGPAVSSLIGGFQEVIAGTKSVEEAFADFLKTIADQLLQTAATMIAQYIALGIAKAFAFGSSPQTPSFSEGLGTGLPLFGDYTGLSGKANGGPVNANQPYIVGERGPELFVPFQQGSITSNEALQQAATTQVPFTRNAESVTQAQETAQAMRAAGPIEVRYESNVINGVEYVTAEQHRKGMAQAAERGRSLTIQALQNSVKTRGRVGL